MPLAGKAHARDEGALQPAGKPLGLVPRVPTPPCPPTAPFIPPPFGSPQQLKGTQDHDEIEGLHVEREGEQSQEGKRCDREIEPGARGEEASGSVTSQTPPATSSGSPPPPHALRWLPRRPDQPRRCTGSTVHRTTSPSHSSGPEHRQPWHSDPRAHVSVDSALLRAQGRSLGLRSP